MAKININTPQQQQQLSGKDNVTKRLPTKGTAIMRYTNNTDAITVTTATTTTTTTTTTARAMANQCMATRWPTATTTRTTTSTTTSASSATMYRKHSNNSHTRWPSGRGCCGGGGGGVTQLKLPWLLLLLITTATATHATAENGAQEAHGSWGGPQAARSNHSRAPTKYSQPLLASSADNDDSFRPIIPKDISPEYISRNVFTETGQYRVFQPVDSDLRVAAAVGYKVGGDNEPLDSSKATTEHTTLQPVNAMAMAMATAMPSASTTIATSSEKLQKQSATATTRIRKTSTTPALRVTKTAKVQSGAGTTKEMQPPVELRAAPAQAARKHEPAAAPPAGLSNALNSEMKGLEELLVEYVENFFDKGQYEPLPGLVFALQKNHTDAAAVAATMTAAGAGNRKKRPTRHLVSTSKLAAANADGSISINIPRAIESGRLFFFSGLKKALWPIFMGLQILKSLLFAMFLPTLIGSFGKLLGKGIISGSSPLFIRPAEAPQDLDFRDNTFNFDDDNKFGMNDGGDKDEAYAYNQAEASQTQNQYVYNPAAINQQALSRYGNEQNKMQDSYLSALQSISSASFKNSNSISGSSSAGAGGGGGGLGAPLRSKPAAPANTYQTFQKVPASSLLLSNYDPFYSPLLSRLDSVFAQLKLNSESESCREKLICLMYANPAKYAPYSNLVSAQLSRELNELRKPTSDNPDILRFFKYMRAAKDGQDGVDCEKSFDRCKEFKDFENPAMVSTYHDINKLVQARKLA